MTPTVHGKYGTLPSEVRVRRILCEAIKRSGKTRPEAAQLISEKLGRTVTASNLADFVRFGTKKRHVRFPAAWVPVFCEVFGDDALQRGVMSERLRELVELGELTCGLPSTLAKMQDLAAKLRGGERQKKEQANRPRKA